MAVLANTMESGANANESVQGIFVHTVRAKFIVPDWVIQ
jgi:hypothetical protein